jgi:hypothetical protein
MIGRDQEIGEITRSITDDAVRGVALGGKAGVGKSRLARRGRGGVSAGTGRACPADPVGTAASRG